MLKRISAVVIAAAMGAATLVASPAAHATSVAKPIIKDISISPSPVVVTSSTEVSATFSFGTEFADPTKVTASLQAPGGATTPLTLTASDNSTKWSGGAKFGRQSAEGDWKLQITAASGKESTSETRGFKVVQVWETDIRGFGASPEPIAAGQYLTVQGALVANSTTGWKALAGQGVWITFKEQGSSSYKRIAWDRTDHRGAFSDRIKVFKSGWWRAEFEGVSNQFHPSTSDSDQVDVRHKPRPPAPKPDLDSRIIKFNASPEPVKYGKYVYLRGVLQVEDRWSWDGYDGKVSIWFKTKHGSWKYVKTTWSNGSGKFYTKTKATKSGYWKAVFGGDRDVDPSSSARDWVRVKR
ncbi:hypothetical protein Aple_102670 [Acrocarpospora pleiomorpha]|uniref:Htaa domain-containing protein n=1 Tax=Acrocarpospora pleiomorpha TaxID=90975 RepID=A0A5M3Y215_9ACTN|nr:hypothetical protein [Acrocarpospora pleiomorpha]GES27367.1 hypothetical protein Aple_102670 [Acrocarpospora pleiomorpha]